MRPLRFSGPPHRPLWRSAPAEEVESRYVLRLLRPVLDFRLLGQRCLYETRQTAQFLLKRGSLWLARSLAKLDGQHGKHRHGSSVADGMSGRSVFNTGAYHCVQEAGLDI